VLLVLVVVVAVVAAAAFGAADGCSSFICLLQNQFSTN